MNKTIGGFFVCLLGLHGLAACNYEHYDDCKGDDPPELNDPFGGSSSRAGSKSSGAAGSTGATGSTGASGGADGADPSAGADAGVPPVVPPQTCTAEADCEHGFNCAPDTQECLPADEETCGELTTEAACSHRSDCTPIYAGTNCSCGPDCECRGGEPGCVCETFGFFACS